MENVLCARRRGKKKSTRRKGGEEQIETGAAARKCASGEERARQAWGRGACQLCLTVNKQGCHGADDNRQSGSGSD